MKTFGNLLLCLGMLVAYAVALPFQLAWSVFTVTLQVLSYYVLVSGDVILDAWKASR